MKRAVILHGKDSNPSANWFPWLKAKLEERGYEVWVPQLPDCNAPNRDTYAEFLFGSGWDFTNNIVVGHSAGAVEVLNLLMDDRMPPIYLGVMVSAWMGGVPKGFDNIEEFAHLFPRHGFKWRHIRGKANHLAFLHGSNDPYCSVDQPVTMAAKLNAPIMLVPDGKHLGEGFNELPQLWEILEPLL